MGLEPRCGADAGTRNPGAAWNSNPGLDRDRRRMSVRTQRATESKNRLLKQLAFMTFLPARRLVRWFAQASHARRLLQPIARRRLAAVRTVQTEPALKLRDMRFQS